MKYVFNILRPPTRWHILLVHRCPKDLLEPHFSQPGDVATVASPPSPAAGVIPPGKEGTREHWETVVWSFKKQWSYCYQDVYNNDMIYFYIQIDIRSSLGFPLESGYTQVSFRTIILVSPGVCTKCSKKYERKRFWFYRRLFVNHL